MKRLIDNLLALWFFFIWPTMKASKSFFKGLILGAVIVGCIFFLMGHQ